MSLYAMNHCRQHGINNCPTCENEINNDALRSLLKDVSSFTVLNNSPDFVAFKQDVLKIIDFLVSIPVSIEYRKEQEKEILKLKNKWNL